MNLCDGSSLNTKLPTVADTQNTEASQSQTDWGSRVAWVPWQITLISSITITVLMNYPTWFVKQKSSYQVSFLRLSDASRAKPVMIKNHISDWEMPPVPNQPGSFDDPDLRPSSTLVFFVNGKKVNWSKFWADLDFCTIVSCFDDADQRWWYGIISSILWI